MLSVDDCFDYLYRFKADRELQIVEVIVETPLRQKAHSPNNVYLADKMYLTWPNPETTRVSIANKKHKFALTGLLDAPTKS
jgi:hypothetical protein